MLEEFGLRADITPTENFGSDGLLELLKGFDVEGCSALRLHSTQAPAKLSAGLAELGVEVEDALLYDTFPLQNYNIPDFDYIFFSSRSCVRSFLAQHAAEALEGKMVLSIGTPTTKVLHSYGIEKIIQANEATTADAFDTLAIEMISDELLGL